VPWIILGIGALFIVAIASAKKSSVAVPIVLPQSGSSAAGETALQQESSGLESTGVSVAASVATGNLPGAAVAAVSGIVSQLTQHSQRLADAKAENTAIPPAVQAFDADLAAIAQAYASGKATPAAVVAAVAELDSNLYGNLRGLVGKPGTAWAPGPLPMTNGTGQPCNTSCTAACCLYYNDLHPPLVVLFQIFSAIAGGQSFAQIQEPGTYYEAVTGGFILKVPEVYPPDDPAYGTFSRPAYQLSFVQQPATPASLLASVI